MPDLSFGAARKTLALLSLAGISLSAGYLHAQELLVHLPLDGSIQNLGSGGAATLAGASTPDTVAGQLGSAMRFNGDAVIAVPVDLSPETHPQLTFTAWVKMDEDARRTGGHTIFSGGGNTAPRLRLLARSAGMRTVLRGARGQVLARDDAPKGQWVFVSGIVDIQAKTLRLVQDESVYTADEINTDTLYPAAAHDNPDDPLAERQRYVFIGADSFNTNRSPVEGVALDDVRVYAGRLEDTQLAAVRGATDAAVVADAGVDLPQRPRTELTMPESPTRAILEDRSQSTADDSGIALLDTPEGLGAGRGERDPELSAPEGLPGQQLQEELDAAREAASRPPPSPGDLEVYRRDADGPVRTMDIILPGRAELETITYQEVDGVAVAEGDIILGTVAELDEWAAAIEDETGGSGALQTRRQGLNMRNNVKFLWPGGIIPYTLHSNMTTAASATAEDAARTLTEMTNLSVIPRTDEANFVEFKLKENDFEACSSRVGMKQSRGSQTIKVDPACSESTLIHEILHAAGFWHEQSRPDRDQYVEILRDNVFASKRHNFNKKSSNSAAGVGTYNYRSVMHYGEFNFGKECLIVGVSDTECRPNADGTNSARTLRVTRPGAVISRDLSTDIDAINAVYPVGLTSAGGIDWGTTHYATAAAIGDVDGDGWGEVVVGRFANDHSRFVILEDALSQHSIITTGPSDWGAGVAVTDVAVGDIDGDGKMEIGVTRKAGDHNRFYVYRLVAGDLRLLFSGGSEWGAGNYATAIAFGDVDGDGRDEIIVGRKANDAGRYYVFDDELAPVPFRRLAIGGSGWGSGHYTTALATGDIDADGRSEIGITRNASSGQRYEVVSLTPGGLVQRHSGGHDWGSGNYGTAIAFGNIDDDPADEILVGRAAGDHSRFFVIDDDRSGFALIETGGDRWGPDYHVVGVDMADVDGDGRDEIIVARNAGENGRYYVFDDRLAGFNRITATGSPLIAGVGATDIAAGDLNNDGRADIVVTLDETTIGRTRYEVLYLNPPLP